MPVDRAKLNVARTLLLVAGAVYIGWWFVVRAAFPDAFNPLGSRLVAGGAPIVLFAATFVSKIAQRYASLLFQACAWAITFHFFYLFHGNHARPEWVVGVFILVPAVVGCLTSRASLGAYSIFVLVMALAESLSEPAAMRMFFFPGVLTIVFLSNIALRNRLTLLDGLAESTRRFRDLFDAAYEGIAVHDDGRILDVNAAMTKISGRTREQLLGTKLVELLTTDSRAGLTTLLADPSDAPIDAAVARADGSRIAVEIAVKAHVHEGRTVQLAAFVDASARRRAEEARAEVIRANAAREAAEEAIRQRDEFMSIASHELKTPLTPLQLHMDILLRALEAKEPLDEPHVARMLSSSQRQIQRLARLTDELLDTSRIEAGQLVLRPTAFDLVLVVKETLEAMGPDLARAGCAVTIEGDAKVDVVWDRLRCEQVVTNLVRNASIYGKGAPIEVTVRATDDTATIQVRDLGIGIAEADRARVFERFARAVPAANYGGLGLGLYIVRQITTAHRGSVRVESKLGEGATFLVEMPRVVA